MNNWLQTNATAGTLTGSVRSATPGFRNTALQDYTLTLGSACIGTANFSVYGLPGKEYYRNETTNRMWRLRAAARDIGAFESTSTNPPVGPYDSIPSPSLRIGVAGGTVTLGWPLFASDFQLQQSPAVLAPNWAPSAFPLSTSAIEVTATGPATNIQVFRLRK